MKAFFVIGILCILAVYIYLAVNGKHNELPFNTETNIPANTTDTPVNTSIKVDKNTGTIIGTQNNFGKDSAKK